MFMGAISVLVSRPCKFNSLFSWLIFSLTLRIQDMAHKVLYLIGISTLHTLFESVYISSSILEEYRNIFLSDFSVCFWFC